MLGGADSATAWHEQEAADRTLFVDCLRWAVAHSPFWSRRCAALRLDPNGIDYAAAAELPLLDKPELLDDQRDAGAGGTLLAVPMSDIRRLHRTSGSTLAPFIVMLSARDVEIAQAVGARALRCAGVRPDDLVIHCLNYSMWSGGVTDHMCYETADAAVIPYGVGNTRFLIDMVRRLRPTAISCTPSYLFRLRELCRSEYGLEPRDLGFRTAFLGGEGGLQEPAYRQQIETEWDMRVVDANYGMSEVLSIFASECEHRRGLHYHAAGVLLPELVDLDGRTVPIAPGAVGELVVSTLTRKAQPLFRYRTHDQIHVVDMECPCGRSGFVFKVFGRTDDMIVVKGINFFPSAVRGVLAEFDESVVGEYRVRRPQSPLEPIRVDIEAAVEGAGGPALAQRIVERIFERLNVSVDVALVAPGTFPRTEDKTRRVS